MSNVELRMMKEEVGIRVQTQIVVLRVLACLLADRYKFLILDTSYLILFLISNVELRMMKEEVGFVC